MDLWKGGEYLFAICMREKAFTLRMMPRGGTNFIPVEGRCMAWYGSNRAGLFAFVCDFLRIKKQNNSCRKLHKKTLASKASQGV